MNLTRNGKQGRRKENRNSDFLYDLGSDKCPYRGLCSFKEEDAHFFYGREKFVDVLVKAVDKQPLIAVFGKSGSGKSSVISAGLIPKLRESGDWHIESFRPTAEPLKKIANTWVRLFESTQIRTDAIDKYINKFKEHIYILKETLELDLEEISPKKRYLIFIDQFEEIYTLASNEDKNLFLEQMLAVIETIKSEMNRSKKNPKMVFVIAMRDDFFQYSISDLGGKWSIESLPDIGLNELTEIIEKPAKKAQFKIQDGLTQSILNDIGSNKNILPLLEFALEQLWKKCILNNDNHDKELTNNTYRDIGGVTQALTNHAKKVFEELDPDKKHQAKNLFTQLVKFGEKMDDTRRLATKKEIGDKNWELVKELAHEDNRLLVIGKNEDDEPTAEIIHEALITESEQLRLWIKQEREFGHWQQDLREAKRIWERRGKWQDDLLRGASLLDAEKWWDEKEDCINSPDEKEYILASRQYQEQEDIERIQELLDSSRKDLLLKQVLSALVLAVKAGVKLRKNIKEPSEDLKINVIERLQQAIYEISEKNRFDGHEDAVVGVDFNYNGQIIASASDDKTVKLWNIYGELVRTLPKHEYEVWGVCFSPDGKTIVSTGNNKIIKLWSIDGELIKTFKGHDGWVWGVSFSPDGQTMASASVDRTVRLWDLDGKSIRTFEKHKNRVWGVCFSPDGQTIASVSDDSIWLWSIDGTKEREISNEIESKEFHAINLSPDGKKIAIASAAKDIEILDLNEDAEPIRLTGHTKRSCGVNFSPDGKIVASASDDMTIRLWSIDGSFVRVLGGHTQKVWSVSFSNDGKFLASASVDKTIRLWNLDSKTFLNTLLGHTETIKTISFSPDGKTLASAGDDKIIRLWDLEGHVLSQELRGHTEQIYSINFSPDGQFIASAGDDKTIRLWNLRDNIEIKVEEVHNDRIYGVSFSPDGKTIASASADSTIKLWDLDGNYLSTLTRVDKRFSGVSFSPDGKTIAASNADSEIILWSINGTDQKILNRHENRVCSISFSPDSQMIASASDDKTVMLWNLNGDTDPKIFTGHDARVCSVSFSPDGKMLASASDDQTIKLWNIDGKCLRTLVGHTEQVLAVSFSPSGEIIASAGEDKTVRLWTVEPDDLIDLDINSKLDKLLQRGRDWIKDYIKTNPNVRANDKQLCDTKLVP